MPAIKTLDESLLVGIHAGTWVAISRDQETIVGTGRTINEALAEAKENGEENPFIIRVPEKNCALIL